MLRFRTEFLMVGLCCSMFLACAGSENKESAESARSRAHEGYAALDESVASQTSVAPASETNTSGFITANNEEPLIVQLSRQACQTADDLRGMGVAQTPQEALVLAQKDIASQIQSSIKAAEQSSKSQNVDVFGNEVVEASYQVKTSVLTELSNAQDAKPSATLVQGQNFGVVACMNRAAAAKPFLNEYLSLQDSIILEVAAFLSHVQPLQKKESYKRAEALFARLLSAKNVLESLNISIPAGSADAGDQTDAMSAYSFMQKSYKEFLSTHTLYYRFEGESAHRNLLFTRISSSISLKEAVCETGLQLVAKISEPICREGSLGINCSAELNLTGSSCSGESYFNLNANVKGNGRYDEAEAMDRLGKNIAEGDWFMEWQKELEKWHLK